jgi:Fe-S-cluster containining protein
MLQRGRTQPGEGQQHCRRCGTCCRKGGPVLRREDLPLLRQGVIRHEQLVAIRIGEQGYNPASGRLEPVPVELLKIRGQGNGWTCLFFTEASNACTIHSQRPLTCRLLACWQPEALLATIYQETLGRREILNPADPLLAWIDRQERECPAAEFTSHLARLDRTGEGADLSGLSALLRADFTLRTEFARQTGLSLAMELFVLGRPFFSQLAGSAVEWCAQTGAVRLRRDQ